MDYYTYSERLNYLLELIEKNRLISPKQIAESFDCSEKTIRRMINCLRLKGYSIKYCRKEMKYILEN